MYWRRQYDAIIVQPSSLAPPASHLHGTLTNLHVRLSSTHTSYVLAVERATVTGSSTMTRILTSFHADNSLATDILYLDMTENFRFQATREIGLETKTESEH